MDNRLITSSVTMRCTPDGVALPEHGADLAKVIAGQLVTVLTHEKVVERGGFLPTTLTVEVEHRTPDDDPTIHKLISRVKVVTA